MSATRRAIEAAILAMSPSDGGYKTVAIDAWSIARDFASPSDLRHLRAVVSMPSGASPDGDSWSHTVQVDVAINTWPGERLTLIGSESVTSDDVALLALRHLTATLLSLPLPDACIIPPCQYTIDEQPGAEYLLVTLTLSLQE